MYKITAKERVYTIPKENIGLLAYAKAMDNGISINPNDSDGAIKYLESIGYTIENIDEPELTEIPKVPNWYDRQHRELYNKLFYYDMDRPLTTEESEFCKTMYYFESNKGG